MKRISHLIPRILTLLIASLLRPAGAADPPNDPGTLKLPAPVQKFIAAKEEQVKAVAKQHQVELWPEMTNLFRAARGGDWDAVGSHYADLTAMLGGLDESEKDFRVGATARQTALEVNLVLDQFAEGEPKFAEAFGRGIVALLPKGSIYFGGTDPGRALPTAFSVHHPKGDPAFVLTQRSLADGQYLTYLRDMYGGQIYVPTAKDSEKAFKDYLEDATRRLDHDEKFPSEPRQVKPGEDIRRNGKSVSVSGQVSVMSINALLARVIFERNPAREFFIEESFPLDWMYPHLSPHGLILKLNRKPLETLSEDTLSQDRKFWSEQQRQLIGGWLTPGTPVKEICRFAEEVWVEKDLDNYEVDPKFVRKDHAGRAYSKLRSAIGGVYSWRAMQAKDPVERERYLQEADFAFRQSIALYPGSAEAVFRYINLLVQKQRLDDALSLAETAGKLDPAAGNFRALVSELKRMKDATKP